MPVKLQFACSFTGITYNSEKNSRCCLQLREVNYSLHIVHQVTLSNNKAKDNQSRTNGPINAHLIIAQVMPRYNHINEKQQALLLKFRQNICSSTAINSATKLFVNAINMYVTFNLLTLEKQVFFFKNHFLHCPGNQLENLTKVL